MERNRRNGVKIHTVSTTVLDGGHEPSQSSQEWTVGRDDDDDENDIALFISIAPSATLYIMVVIHSIDTTQDDSTHVMVGSVGLARGLGQYLVSYRPNLG